ncbi:MAG: hypothetical protein ACFCUO_10215 [Rhodospirillales bacterium]
MLVVLLAIGDGRARSRTGPAKDRQVLRFRRPTRAVIIAQVCRHADHRLSGRIGKRAAPKDGTAARRIGIDDCLSGCDEAK